MNTVFGHQQDTSARARAEQREREQADMRDAQRIRIPPPFLFSHGQIVSRPDRAAESTARPMESASARMTPALPTSSKAEARSKLATSTMRKIESDTAGLGALLIASMKPSLQRR